MTGISAIDFGSCPLSLSTLIASPPPPQKKEAFKRF